MNKMDAPRDHIIRSFQSNTMCLRVTLHMRRALCYLSRLLCERTLLALWFSQFMGRAWLPLLSIRGPVMCNWFASSMRTSRL
ncbi:hypothetical protein F0562_015484 [Nyssa sinensis]|uniref:Uncharacterized protein n=1 Tax=Nyssa sinensis TaxID=561372 RepID=A0A5J4ZHF5_9ASTE|nr:hypothetical protein F0562_015484 [Nyssa sinensis]